MTKETVFIVLLFSAVIGSYVSVAQLTITPSDQIVTLLGKNVTALCRAPSSIAFCRFESPSGNGYILSPSAPGVNGIEYFGRGLDTGECGISINPVREEHNGRWQCSVPQMSSSTEIQGQINITVAKMPEQPVLLPQEISGVENDIRDLSCTVRGARPAATIQWYIGNDMWTTLTDVQYTFYPPTPDVIQISGADTFTTQQNLSVTLNYKLHGKDIKCLASVPQVENSTGEYNELADVTPVIVEFPPKPIGPITQYDVQIGSEARVAVNISANPRPSTQWTVSNTVVHEGMTEGRFTAQVPVENRGSPGTWEVVLTISNVEEKDMNSEIVLTASNYIGGQQDYRIQITPGSPPATAGLGIGAIIGIVLAVLFVFFLIFLCIFARATGRWCFAAGGTERESSDTESADRETPKKNKKSKMPSVPKGISFLKKGKNDKAMGDVESLKKLDKEKPSNDKIVYAELSLANSDNAPRKEAEKTEYAEIIGTVKLPNPESPNKI